MDIQPTTQKPISDDQELAKVLAGVSTDDDSASDDQAVTADTAVLGAPSTPPVATPAEDEESPEETTETEPAENALPTPTPPVVTDFSLPTPATPTSPVSSGGDDLEGIKKDALNELRPLVDKLNLAPEEKFDTYLLLLRSTDDRALIGPAHEAAQAITDESRKAQALLDIIKEIDFLSNPQ